MSVDMRSSTVGEKPRAEICGNYCLTCLRRKPTSHDHAKHVQPELASNELATWNMLSRFGGPDWYDGIQDVGTKMVEHAAGSCRWTVKL